MSSLIRQVFNHTLIWLVLPLVVVLAIYVSVGRYFFPLLESYRDDVVLWVNDRLPVVVQLEQLSGDWNRFDPFIQLDNISLFSRYQQVGKHENSQPAIQVEHFSLELDSLSSFRYQQPVIRQAAIEGVTLRLQQQDDMSWILKGWEDFQSEDGDGIATASQQAKEDVSQLSRLLSFLMHQQHLKMEYVWLELFDRYGRQYRAFSKRIEAHDLGDGRKRLQGSLQLNAESAEQAGFILEVSGDPFDQSTLALDLYLQADPQSLTSWIEKFADLLPVGLPKFNAGIELWSHWQGGKLMSLQGEVTAKEITLSYQQRPDITLTDLNSVIHLERQPLNNWQLILDQLDFSLQGQHFPIDQLIIDSEKGGNQLKLQLAALDLGALYSVLKQVPELPEEAQDALNRLKPRGHLRNLVVSYFQSQQSEAIQAQQLTEVENLKVEEQKPLADAQNPSTESQDPKHKAEAESADRQAVAVRPGAEVSTQPEITSSPSSTTSDASDIAKGPTSSVIVTAELDQVSVDAYYGAPALTNVSGFLQTDQDEGFIRFASDNFAMDFPLLYPQGWQFEHAEGQVDWRVGKAVRVFGQDLMLKKGSSEVFGEFDVLLHNTPEDDLFYLNVAVRDVHDPFGLTLVPERILRPEIMQWLKQSIQQAHVKEGGFIYDGSLLLNAENPVRAATTHLMLDIDQGQLKFLPEWPAVEALTAKLFVDGTELRSEVSSARYLGNEGLYGQVNLVNDDIGGRVQTNLKGQLIPEQGWQVFSQTPLQKLVPETLFDWQLSGKKIWLNTWLDFPIDGREGNGWVRVKTQGNSLLIPELGTPLDNIDAEVEYDLAKGLSAKQGKAEFLAGPAQFDIHTDMEQGTVMVEGLGQAEVDALSLWQPMPFSPWLSGTAPYNFFVRLDKVSQLHLISELQGVEVRMPPPMSKTAEMSTALDVNMSFSAEENRFAVQYGDHVNAKGLWLSEQKQNTATQIKSEQTVAAENSFAANIWLGDLPKQMLAPSTLTGRTDIHFQQNQINAESWIEFIKAEQARVELEQSVVLSSAESAVDSDQAGVGTDPVVARSEKESGRANSQQISGLTRFHLETKQLRYGDMKLENFVLDAEQDQEEYSFRFASPQIQGEANMTEQLTRIELEHLFYDSPENEAIVVPKQIVAKQVVPKQKEDSVLDQVFTSQWPDFDLKIKDFQVNRVVGKGLDISYRSKQDKRQLTLNSMTQGSIGYNGVLDWYVPEDSKLNGKIRIPQSTLVFNVQGDDLADAQKAFAIKPVISSQKAKVSSRLIWPGLPNELAADKLSGDVTIQLEKGEFEQVSSAPALRLISLFNFGALVRRLQLDFSDMSGKGLSYDKVSGRVTILNGLGTLKEPLKVDGSATKFEMTGNIDFIDETLEQDLIVTLPVAETLPFAAVLAGAPQLGGTIYIAQKVLGNLFDKFTRARYSVTGAWDNPKIELKRVF